MKQKIRQIIFEMRRQPLVGWVTLIATALSVFLFMVVFITQRVKTVPFAPESCRDRLMIGQFIHVKDINTGNDASGGLGYYCAKQIYEGLDGVERSALMLRDLDEVPVRGTSASGFQAQMRTVDADFFKIFDHTLLAGRYFTSAEVNSNLHVAVISESIARKAFGKTDCVGETIKINHRKYTVTGVVKDNSFLATSASGDVFTPYAPPVRPTAEDGFFAKYFGNTAVALLVKDGVDFQHIRDQVKARYAELATEIKSEGWTPVYHEQPYDQETIALGQQGSNVTPEPSGDSRLRIFFYAILLIVPAINLSSLLHSRMQRRVSEIGVRRAYGCTRGRIIADIIWENFLITLAGGLVGVALGVIFAMTYSDLYANMDNYGQTLAPALSAVINWSTVAMAIGVCFILNIISASIPAWQASRLNPVEAINKK